MKPSDVFRRRMQVLRRARNMTQADLAEVLRIDRTTVARMECGTRGLSLNEAVAVASALGVDLDAMVSGEPVTVTL